MAPNSSDIKNRWDRIRKNELCDLELTPQAVSEYLGTPESELVLGRIRESLLQFAQYRSKKGFVSEKPAPEGRGDLATCEGLEAFLVPAVQGALPLSKFLTELEAEGQERATFAKDFVNDMQGLLDNWGNGQFSGEPYGDPNQIFNAIKPNLQEEFKSIDITEAAAMACRVLIHVLTLKLNRPAEENKFREEIGQYLDDARMFDALSQAIDFLVSAFQKTSEGSAEDRIVNSKFGNYDGSGWSWTDRAGLPPMLFFTAAAVEAFAELDLYLIRPALTKTFAGDQGDQLAKFYSANEQKLQRFQLCVEMARRWIQKFVLPALTVGFGQHVGWLSPDTELKYENHPEGYDDFKRDLDLVKGLSEPPMVFYNNLYALIVLLWSWGDWTDDGSRIGEEERNRINRALVQIVYNYAKLPVVKEILNRFPYVFYLPGKGIFQEALVVKPSYMDSAFPQLLTRLLVLFVVYGVGDRSLLEPVIRELYVELLQSRNRKRLEYSALWPSDRVEIFATQRAIQALTFYYAYARGKELVEGSSRGTETIMLRNKTGVPLILEAVTERQLSAAVCASPSLSPPPGESAIISAKDFSEYCHQQVPGWKFYKAADEAEMDLQQEVNKLGNKILKDNREGGLNVMAAKLILNQLARLGEKPTQDKRIRHAEYEVLRSQYEDLRSTA